MADNKYVSLNRLSQFLNQLTLQFAPMSHTHTKNEIEDLTDAGAITGTPGQFVVIGEDGKPVAQTIVMNVYYKGTTEPNNSLGNDGDLYLMKE